MREIKSYPIVNKLINMFDNWLKHRQEISEMREFDAGEFARIAHELGVTPNDLDTLVRRGPHAIEELPKLLTARCKMDGQIDLVRPRFDLAQKLRPF
jgi:hypothetical protein